VVARGYQLQVLKREELAAIAKAGYSGVVELPPRRGTIFDREGNELAVSVEVASVYAHPSQVKEKGKAARELGRVLEMSPAAVREALNKDARFVWIERKIPPEKGEAVRALGLEGVGTTLETRRFYPCREIAGQLIGFSGTDNQGLEGLELAYDRVLRGPGFVLMQMRDALGRPFYVSRPTPRAKDGGARRMHDLVLTIDKHIQYRAQEALKDALESSGAKGGHCIVVDPRTGEVLAMAVTPPFNPNVFSQYDPADWRNRAVTDCFEPGSTIKAFLLAAALDKGVVSPQTVFDCENGEMKVGSHIIHDTHEYGELTVADIVVLSSNIGAVKIGWKLGYRTFTDYLRGFGFGKKTGIDLVGERDGLIRPAEQVGEVGKANLFFGQGMTATSIQLVMAMAAIANGGKLMRPYVVSEVRASEGGVVGHTTPQVVRRVLPEETARRTARILRGVVSEKGTAPLAAIPGFTAAGKTGTAQKVDPRTGSYSRSKYVALFVGFAPVEDPRLVCLVLLDEPKKSNFGGIVAAPVFKEVSGAALSHLGVKPRLRPARLPLEDQSYEQAAFEAAKAEPVETTEDHGLGGDEDEGFIGDTASGAAALPDFTGESMREVLLMGSRLGIRVEVQGSGFAVEQSPGPGVDLSRVEKVKVRFNPPM
jgi:cell division protein FtsI (penicillin-binding protein 3)